VDQFADAGTPVACLCSSDNIYAAEAAAAAAELRRAGARHIWLAGKAQVPGVDDRLYSGCDALDVLDTTFDALAVPQ
jgi:methylmalonyl-CoA mutase